MGAHDVRGPQGVRYGAKGRGSSHDFDSSYRCD